MSYYLNVIKKADKKLAKSLHNAIQGSIPDEQATQFFKLPVNERDMNYFIDTFDEFWNAFLAENPVDFGAFATQVCRQKKLPAPEDPEELRAFGYKLKYEETKEHCFNLMKLLSHLRIHKMEAETQASFNVTLEPASEKNGVFTPELRVGGRIDLVVLLARNEEEIWDIKAVKNPNGLDSDQLLMYKMGRQAQGKIVKRTGYLHAKQCKATAKKFYPAHEEQLKKMLRQAMIYFKQDSWPANYRDWKCGADGYCDVKAKCPKALERAGNNAELVKLMPGKVPI